MPGSANIYGPRTSKQVSKAVKNFNAKISRELKKDPAAAAWLPDRISVKTFKAENRTRHDVNQALKDVRAFAQRGAQEPVFLNDNLQRTAWEVKKVYRDAEITNQRRAKDLKHLAPNTKAGTMGLAEAHNLAPMKIQAEKMSLKEWKAKSFTAGNESKKDYTIQQQIQYKENYIELLSSTLGQFAGPILDLLKQVSPSQMVEAYKNNPVLYIKFLYDPQEAAFLALNILEGWQQFLGMPNTAEDDLMGAFGDAFNYEDPETDF